MTDQQREAEIRLRVQEIVDRHGGYPETGWFDTARFLLSQLDAARQQLAERDAENERLRKIAAHVPGLIWIKAKEAAGFGEKIKTNDALEGRL